MKIAFTGRVSLFVLGALLLAGSLVAVGCASVSADYQSRDSYTQGMLPQDGRESESARSSPDPPVERGGRERVDVDLDWLGNGDELWVIERGESWEEKRAARVDRNGMGGMRARVGRSTESLPLAGTGVRADLVGFIGHVTVQQEFVNPWDDVIEAVYVFPLVDDAAVTGFVMEVGGRRIRAIVRERAQAERIYEAAKNQGRRASLLKQERANVFAQRVANIDPGERVSVEITYFHTLRYEEGEMEFVLPMVVGPRYQGGALAGGGGVSGYWDVGVVIDAGAVVEGVRCLSHDVEVEAMDGERVRVRLAETGEEAGTRDFVLRYRVAGRAERGNMVAWRDAGGEGYFALAVHAPNGAMGSGEREPIEAVFVVDTSGSMEGRALQQAKRVVRGAMDAMGAGDAFQVVRFADGHQMLTGGLAAYDSVSAGRALDRLARVDARGGTELETGVRSALRLPSSRDHRRVVVLVTDGLVGNEEAVVRTVAEELDGARVVVVGIGDSPNRLLTERVARVGLGGTAYVGLEDDAARIGRRVMERVRGVSLTDIEIDWNGLGVSDLIPRRMGELYAGRMGVVVGRIVSGEELDGRSIWVSGMSGDREVRFPVRIDARGGGDRRVLGALWARQAIMDLTERAVLFGDARYLREVEELALDFGLASARTAFVVADGMGRGTRGNPRRVDVPGRVERGEEWER